MDMAHYMIKSLLDSHAERKERSDELWRMSPDERVAAMRRGELAGWQLYEWAARRPQEVPLINDEFEFIARNTPEVAEARD
jgi:hypothetical protein